ncbi:phosphonopyruvate decarboxylase [Bacteroides cutis]|jgi:phosphonopyruvate decarboxylase|uniref:phosphonopyruvate decarboxylase n=1 Tax=Bacteroides cutis TaxID=2024197 RepID=UPI000C77B579|nr:phosphonopyruvate decarboxylase [Bacteroides cutis]
MISPKFFIETLKSYDIDFYAGVPDSLLKNICAYIADNMDAQHNIIAANEGAAVGLAAGYHLATGKAGVVYMQNSGEGNIINPLASLTDKEVYNIPVLLLIGWRGRPGVRDEPQHVKQGKVTTGILNTMGINYDVLSTDEEKAAKQIAIAVEALKNNEVYALVIEKGTFEDYKLQSVEINDLTMTRESAIQAVAAALGEKDAIVSTTGMISRELFEYRANNGESHNRDFLTVGSMGHASQIALGIAMQKTDRTIWCFDGDGAIIMHMGSMAIVASKEPRNFVHVVFNNGAHDSVGGQPTVGLKINFPCIARGVGYKHTFSVSTMKDLEQILEDVKKTEGPTLLEVKVKKGNRKNLGRPTTTPVQNKEALMDFLSK